MPILDIVAAALDAGDHEYAANAASLLDLPDLDWEGAVRIANAENARAKFNVGELRDWRGRWTTGGTSSGASTMSLPADWRHRRSPLFQYASYESDTTSDDEGSKGAAEPAVTADDIPGSADVSDDSVKDWVRLPPGERDDEVADLVEWIANAKPEDETAIHREIKRQFYDVGDDHAGDMLTIGLAQTSSPNTTRETRHEVLNNLERYTRIDPSVAAGRLAILNFFLGLRLPGPVGRVWPFRGAAAASNAWKLGWAAHGVVIETALGANLPRTFPVVDKFPNGVVTSIKSIDLNAGTYKSAPRLLWSINRYVDKVVAFNGAQVGESMIKSSDIIGRALQIAIPNGSIAAVQKAAFDAAISRARKLGVGVIVAEF